MFNFESTDFIFKSSPKTRQYLEMSHPEGTNTFLFHLNILHSQRLFALVRQAHMTFMNDCVTKDVTAEHKDVIICLTTFLKDTTMCIYIYILISYVLKCGLDFIYRARGACIPVSSLSCLGGAASRSRR